MTPNVSSTEFTKNVIVAIWRSLWNQRRIQDSANNKDGVLCNNSYYLYWYKKTWKIFHLNFIKTKEIGFMRKNVNKMASCTSFFTVRAFAHNRKSIFWDVIWDIKVIGTPSNVNKMYVLWTIGSLKSWEIKSPNFAQYYVNIAGYLCLDHWQQFSQFYCLPRQIFFALEKGHFFLFPLF